MKSRLADFYKDYYSASVPSSSTPSVQSTASTATLPSSSFDFLAIFNRAPAAQPAESELDAYFKMPAADFRTTCPIQWWHNHRFQFPHLYQLAFDIFGIPGSAVAVERVFSGGRDTISLRRASLKPKTIRMLMLSKQTICRKRRTA